MVRDSNLKGILKVDIVQKRLQSASNGPSEHDLWIFHPSSAKSAPQSTKYNKSPTLLCGENSSQEGAKAVWGYVGQYGPQKYRISTFTMREGYCRADGKYVYS